MAPPERSPHASPYQRSNQPGGRVSGGSRLPGPRTSVPDGGRVSSREGAADLHGRGSYSDRDRDRRRDARESWHSHGAKGHDRDGGRGQERSEGRDRQDGRSRGDARDRPSELLPRPSSASSLRSPPGPPAVPRRPQDAAAGRQQEAAGSAGPSSLRHSSLVADAAKHVRARQAKAARAEAGSDDDSPPLLEGKRKGRWVDDDGDDARESSAEPEDGELQAAPSKRPRHEPIVWHTAPAGRGDPQDRDNRDQRHRDRADRYGRDDAAPSKSAAAGTASPGGQLSQLRAAALRRQEGAGSSGALAAAEPPALDPPSRPGSALGHRGSPAPGPRGSPLPPRASGGLTARASPVAVRSSPVATLPEPRSAAAIAMAELEAFQAGQSADDLGYDPSAPAAMKASPTPSGSEGEDAAKPALRLETKAEKAEDEDAASEASLDDGTTPSMRAAKRSRWQLDEDMADEEAAKAHEAAVEAEAAVAALNADELATIAPEDSEQLGSESLDDDPDAPRVRGVSMLNACRSVEEFERLNRISEGTYGVVYRAREKSTGRIVALKKVKMDKERDGFPLTALREVNILLSFHHESIVEVSEVVVGKSLDSVFMVMEYMEHDLKKLLEDMPQPFSIAEVKTLMFQLFDAMDYLHDNWVLHRDLKTSNILYNSRGELKICDFGLARQYGEPLQAYTHMVVTLWYRCPELLLGTKVYSTAVDMWSLGCIMAELLTKKVLFDGRSELDQLDRIFKTLGSPNEKNWSGFDKLPNASKIKFPQHQRSTLREKFPPPSALAPDGQPRLTEKGFDLLSSLLALDPSKRITASEALKHPWFLEHPQMKDKALMPTFPSRNDGGMRTHKHHSPDPRIQEGRLAALSKAQEKGGLFNF